MPGSKVPELRQCRRSSLIVPATAWPPAEVAVTSLIVPVIALTTIGWSGRQASGSASAATLSGAASGSRSASGRLSWVPTWAAGVTSPENGFAHPLRPRVTATSTVATATRTGARWFGTASS